MKNMTKERFIQGTIFMLANWSHHIYKYRKTDVSSTGCIVEDGGMFSSHAMNIEKIGTRGIEGYSFVMNRKVTVKIKYTDMIVIEPDQINEYGRLKTPIKQIVALSK